MSHTLGPWDHSRWIVGLIGAPDNPVAEVVGMPWVNAEVATANARLIAAAPDLLEALEAALAFVNPATATYDDAKAAIEKATGQEVKA